MKRRLIDVIVILAIIAFFLTSIINYNVIEIRKYDVGKGNVIDTSTMSGEIKTKEVIEVVYNKDCIILEYFANEGELIRVGDPVFKLDMSFDLLSINTERKDLMISIEREKANLISQGIEKLNIERKRLMLLEEEYNKLNDQYINDQTLFDAGIIIDFQLRSSKANRDIKSIELEEARVSYQLNLEIRDINEQEVMMRLNELDKKLKYLDIKEYLYVSVDEQGIYYSEYNGIVTNLVQLGVLNMKDTNLLEVSVIDNFSSYIFIGYVDIEDSHKIEEGNEVDFYDGVISDPIKGRILEKAKTTENGKVKIMAEFLEDRSAKLGYGRFFYAESIEKPATQHLIPKSAVLTNKIIKVGDIVELYAIQDNDKGQPIAKLVSVEIEYVGDQTLGIIMDSSDIYIDSVILNPSFKIKDGVRIKW